MQIAARGESSFSSTVSSARRATAVAFVSTGVVFASWVTRIPQIREELQLTAAELGAVLLSLAVGSLLALPAASALVRRIDARATVSIMAIVTAAGLTVIGIGYLSGTVFVVVGLFLLGFGLAAWNVAMNVHGAVVERLAGRAIMPRFHAGFSIGMVSGALLAAGLIAMNVPITTHLTVVAAVVTVVVLIAIRRFLPSRSEADLPSIGENATGRPRRSLDRRTALIGVVVLAFAFAEGAGADWITVAFVDDLNTSAAVASLGYATFLTAMTLGRWIGPRLIDRVGRVSAIRGLAVIALVGLVVFVLSPWPWLAFVGVLLWGLGACLGYPVAVSAAADEPRLAAQRVSTVSGIGQLAFLGGPPLIGLLGSLWTVQQALIVVPVLIAIAIAASGALAPPRTENGSDDSD